MVNNCIIQESRRMLDPAPFPSPPLPHPPPSPPLPSPPLPSPPLPSPPPPLPSPYPGALCGECENGTGVGVLRTNCRECSGEAYYALGILSESAKVAITATVQYYVGYLVYAHSTVFECTNWYTMSFLHTG